MRSRSTSQLRAEITTLQERIRQLEEQASLHVETMEAPRLREHELRTLAEHCPDVIARFDSDLRHIYVSPAIQAITGLSPDTFIGKTNRELEMPDALVAEWEAALRRVFTTGQTVALEFGFPSAQGPLYFEARLTPERAADGTIQSVFSVSRDITMRKGAEVALTASEERYCSLFEHSIDGILQTAPEGRILAANPAACRMLGWREDELVRIGRAGVVDPTDPRLPILLEERARTGKSRGELTFVRKDGTKFSGEISSAVFSDQDGSPRTSMVIHDLSERKQAEEALPASERFARATIDALAAHICVLDETGTIIAVNKAWRDFAAAHFADPQRVAEGADYLAVCDAATGPDADIARAWGAGLRAVMNKERDEFSLEYPCHSPAEQRWFTGTARRFAERDPVRVVVAHENITARKLVEIVLQTSEEQYRIVADNTYDWEFWRGPDGRFVYVSPSCERITGHTPEEFAADPDLFRRIIHPDDQRRLGDGFWNMTEHGDGEQEFRVLRPDGTERWVAHVCQPIHDAAGCFLGRRGSNRDISERERAEEALAQNRVELKAIYDHAPVMMCVIDASRRVLYANRLFAAFTGVAENDLQAGHACGVFGCVNALTDPRGCGFGEDCDQCALRQAIEDTFRTGRAHWNIECRLLLERDSVRQEVVLLGATALIQADDRTNALLCLQDISGRVLAEKTLERRNRQLQALLDAAKELNATLDGGAVMRRLAAIGMELLGATAGMAGLVDDGELVFTEYNDGGLLRPIHYRFSPGHGVPGLVMQTKIPYICHVAQDDPHVIPEIREALGFTNFLGVPILDRHGQVLGYFEILNSLGGRPFTPEDVAMLEGVATIAAIAVENSRLFKELRRGRERLRALSRRQVEMQENERRALARELHDEIGQLLTGLKLTLDMLTGAVSTEGLESLREGQELVAALIREVRDLSLTLRPPILDDLGLLPALLWQFERYTAHTHVQVTFTHSGLESRPCSPAVETAAYRIVQEALTNVARHAAVETVCVWARVMNGGLVIDVEDQGGGFEPSLILSSEVSVGLLGMQERARLLGGRLRIESSPGAGTRIAAELPLEEGRRP
jgi:PAS domain S-box-containing protein